MKVTKVSETKGFKFSFWKFDGLLKIDRIFAVEELQIYLVERYL